MDESPENISILSDGSLIITGGTYGYKDQTNFYGIIRSGNGTDGFISKFNSYVIASYVINFELKLLSNMFIIHQTWL